MIKTLKIAALVIGLSVIGTMPASAGIKFDISATAGKVTETVSGWAQSAQKYIEESETLQTLVKYGKGAKEAAKQLNDMKNDATSAMSDVTGAANSIKDTATSTVGDISGEVGGLAGEATGAVGAATGGVGGALAEATSKTQNAQKLLELKNQKAQLASEFESEKSARKVEFDGQIKSYQDNNASYQQMIAENPERKEELETKIISNNEVIRFLTEQFNKREQEYQQAYQKEVLALDEQLEAVRAQSEAEGLAMASAGADAFKKLFGGNGSAAELNKMIANNFVPANQAVSNDSVKKVRAYRQLVYGQDAIKAYAAALEVKSSRYDSNKTTEEVKGKATIAEGTSASISLDTELKVQQMQSLLLYTKALIAEMKMRSASDLAGLTVYQLRDPSKDVTQFNLDDYKYKKSKKSLGQMVGSAKKAAGSVTSGLNDGKNLLGEVKGGL